MPVSPTRLRNCGGCEYYADNPDMNGNFRNERHPHPPDFRQALFQMPGCVPSHLVVWRLVDRADAIAKTIARMDRRPDRGRADARDAMTDLKNMLAEQNWDIKTLLGRRHQIHWNDRTQPPR